MRARLAAPRGMKQRAAKKKQTKKVRAAKAKAKAARRAAADADGDVAMDAEVRAADADVDIAEAEAEAKPSGRAARALKVQARRALKAKLSDLRARRQKIAKRDVALKTTRKLIGAKIKRLVKGDDADAPPAAAVEDSDLEWEEEDVDMAE